LAALRGSKRLAEKPCSGPGAGSWQQNLEFFGTPLFIEPSQGQLSGDAGLLPIWQFDGRIGLTRAFADALAPGLIRHTLLDMVRARVYSIRQTNDIHIG